MDTSLVFSNLLSPPILFFFLGALATGLKSDLEVPNPLSKFFSLYLLLAIGFKGGVELNASGARTGVIASLLAALVMASIVPIYTFFILRLRLGVHDAAAIAATYGSISAVTFITATSFLQRLGIDFGGHLVAAMALMESPAIVIGVLLYRLFGSNQNHNGFSWRLLLKDAFLNGSVVLIVGSLVIGLLTGSAGAESLKPFSEDIFKGMLCFFLLDMGLVAARRLRDLRSAGGFLTLFAIVIPLINGFAGIVAAGLLDMSAGDALLFSVLCASASYIAVPAAMRLAVPDANPGLYLPMSLAITFPFNIVFGLPLFLHIINWMRS